MKRLVVLLFGLVGVVLFMLVVNLGDCVLCDSIFYVYWLMFVDIIWIVFVKEVVMGYVKESWVLELLDLVLVFVWEIKDVEGELEF